MHAHRSLFLALGFLLPALAGAQPPELKIPSLADLHSGAIESVNFTLGPVALGFMRFMSRVSGDDDPEAQMVLQDLHKLQVRRFEFTNDPGHPQKDLEELRSQLTAPGWNRVVEVRNSREQKNVDVYMSVEQGRVNGMVVIASEPRAFTVVNIVGSIDLQKLHQLEGKFGIPKVQRQESEQP